MKAVLFIHGLSAKKIDNKYFINKMKMHNDIDLYSFVLPGHENDEVKKVKYQSWLDKSEEELKKILLKYKKVTIVAHSMGCIIAVNLASHYEQIEKLVLIAPAFVFGSIKQNYKDLDNLIHKKINEDIGTGFEGVFKKIVSVPRYVVLQYRIMANKNIKNIKNIKCPTLIMHGIEDNIISIRSSKMVYNRLTCPKDLVLIENVRHQVFKSVKKEEITKYIYNFITFDILYKLNRKQKI